MPEGLRPSSSTGGPGDPARRHDGGVLRGRRAALQPRALTWERGEKPEWRRSARWHTDASNSSGFERHEREYPYTVENSEKLARYAARHRPFYEQLHAQRMNVSPWEGMTGS